MSVSVKELTKITLIDLWKEYNSIEGDFWDKQEEAVKEFRRTFIKIENRDSDHLN